MPAVRHSSRSSWTRLVLLPAQLADFGHHQQGALGTSGRAAGGQDAVEFFLQGVDDVDEIDGRAMEGRGRQQDPRGFSLARRHQVGHVQIGGPPLVVHAHRGDQIQAQQGQVDQIVARQGFVAQVGVHQAQTAEAAVAGAQAAHLGQDQARGVADDDVLDGALARDQHADLAGHGAGDLAQIGPELGRDDLARRDPPTVDAFEGRDLGRLEARAISRHLMHGTPGARC
jgi:hypothetical protein